MKKAKSDVDESTVDKEEMKLKQAFRLASAQSQAAEARRKSLQSKLDEEVNALASAQLEEHDDQDGGVLGQYVENDVSHLEAPAFFFPNRPCHGVLCEAAHLFILQCLAAH